jgi:signal transduction histidine kinase
VSVTEAAGQTSPRLRLLAWAIFGVAAAAVAIGSALLVVQVANGSVDGSDAVGQFALLPPAAAFSIVGLVVALRLPRNPCGWLMLVIGACWSLGVSPPADPDSTFTWATAWGWVPPFGLMATHLPLRLPNGRLLTPRWRWVSRSATAAMVLLSVGLVFDPENPANPMPNDALALLGMVGLVALAVCVVLSVASLVVRSRRAGADERHQIRWIAAGAAVFLLGWLMNFAVSAVFSIPDRGTVGSGILVVATLLAYAAIPVGIGIAILKYRLYDIDVVIRKALVVAVLAAFFTLVYTLVVGGVGAIVGARSTTGLSFVAAALVAVGVQPVLVRARRFADRVVYGKRATPYEVLAAFSERVGEMYVDDDVLQDMARVVAEGIGAAHAEVWIRFEDRLRVGAAWPPSDGPERASVPVGDGRISIGGADASFAIEHRGELLGAISVTAAPSDPMDPAKARLVGDLAAQAGLVLRNARLGGDLRARLADLQAAQKRLVTAQDGERRRIERNIHDGAQQQLVALTLKAKLARQFTREHPAKAGDILGQIEEQTTRALEDLRDLARGIYPPLLADQGLLAALRAQARKVPVPTTVQGDGIGRFDQDVEAAVYFSCLEALQNVAKYARASNVTVRLSNGDGTLTFRIEDDGVGFDTRVSGGGTGLQGMADRVGALRGAIEVRSAPGAGTTVVGMVPVAEEAADVLV